MCIVYVQNKNNLIKIGHNWNGKYFAGLKAKLNFLYKTK